MRRFSIVLLSTVLLATGCTGRPRVRDRRLSAVMLRPDIISRQLWDQGLPSGRYVNQKPQRLVILDEGEIALRITNPPKYLNYVREHGGGRDVPCHYYIDRAGHIYEGRIPEVQGDLGDAGTVRDGDVLVSLLDDTEARPPSKEALASLVQLCAWFCAYHERLPEQDLHTLRSLGQGRRPGVHLELLYQEGAILAAVRKLYPPAPPEPEF
ncbi:N-acetylmuramoyl-L-alanine amidase [bacterium]|nr:N-acetylmuramoyl-L-alanine amidase [bacterium]